MEKAKSILHFVKIDGILYCTARELEDVAAELGSYEVYEYAGDKAGPRHPGTVVVNAIKAAMADVAVRKKNNLRNTDFAKLEYGAHGTNDDVIHYLIHEKIITKNDMDIGYHNLNIFTYAAALAVVRQLNRDISLTIPEERVMEMPRIFTDCALSPLLIQKKEQRVTRSLFD